MKDPDSEGSIT